MIVMLDTPTDLEECERELGVEHVEQLLTPLTRYKAQRPGDHFAVDNGAFSNFNSGYFRSLLARHFDRRTLCRFVAVPDVVGSARRTLEVFEFWKAELKDWPLALVCQNGQEHHPIPWHEITAIFIGGDTAWKIGPDAAACIKAAKAIYVHATLAAKEPKEAIIKKFKGKGKIFQLDEKRKAVVEGK